MFFEAVLVPEDWVVVVLDDELLLQAASPIPAASTAPVTAILRIFTLPSFARDIRSRQSIRDDGRRGCTPFGATGSGAAPKSPVAGIHPAVPLKEDPACIAR